MKGCVIGNSHVGAIKLAWEELGGHCGPIDAMTFFAAKSLDMAALKPSGNSLTTDDPELRKALIRSGGSMEIDCARFDFIMVHGSYFGMSALGSALSTHHPKALHGKLHITTGCLSQIWEDELETTLAFKLLALVRSVSNMPVVMSVNPLVGSGLQDTGHSHWGFLDTIDRTVYDDCFVPAAQRLCRRLGVHYLGQPRETLDPARPYTLLQYSTEPAGLNGKFANIKIDHAHMNGVYGKLVLRDLVALLAAVEPEMRASA
ncbi:MAG: hypothetical protein AB7O57_00170 [Hyphomicrobiaceae bacterium]